MSTSNSSETTPRASRWNNALTNLTLFAAVFFLCGVLAEVTLRLMGYGNVEIYEPDPKVIWRLSGSPISAFLDGCYAQARARQKRSAGLYPALSASARANTPGQDGCDARKSLRAGRLGWGQGMPYPQEWGAAGRHRGPEE